MGARDTSPPCFHLVSVLVALLLLAEIEEDDLCVGDMAANLEVIGSLCSNTS